MIPIVFQFNGKEYRGDLSPVFGAGEHNHFHLMIDNYYCGRLRFANCEWVFDSNPLSKGWERLADYFGEVIQAWYQ